MVRPLKNTGQMELMDANFNCGVLDSLAESV